MSAWLRVFRAVANSLAFFFLVTAASAFLSSNPPLAILLFAAAFDQLKDVYRMVTGRRLFPESLRILDNIFEGIMLVFAFGMLLFSLMYYAYFQTWFFRVMLFVSILIIWSSIEELLGVEIDDEEVRPPAYISRR